MIISFVGDNSFARERAARDYIDTFVGTHGTFEVDRLNGEDIDADMLGGAVSTPPFLSQRRLVVVRDLGTNKLLNESFVKIAPTVADTTDLVVIEGRVDGRSKYLQALKDQTDFREFTQLDGDALVRWIALQVADKGGSIERRDAQYIVDRVGSNQQMIANEIDKLLAYTPKITKESIESLTDYLPQSSIFAMLESAFSGDVKKALDMYQEQRLQGMEPQAILGMIAWQLHILALVKTGQDKTPADLASSAKLNPFVVRKSMNITKKLSFDQLVYLLDLATATDAKLKTVKMNADNALTALIIACASST